MGTSQGTSGRHKHIADAVMLGALLIGGSHLARQATGKVWDLLSRGEPPDPDDPDTAWRDALAWSLASGVAVGVARLMVRREFARLRQVSAAKTTARLPR